MADETYRFQVHESRKSEFTRSADADVLMGGRIRPRRDAAKYDAWFRVQVQVGLASVDAGRLIPEAEVDAKFAAKRAATQRRLTD